MDISTENWERDQEFLDLVQDSFLSQHVLESTRGKNILDIVLSSQKEFVDNVKIYEPLGCSYHNQIYLIIKVKGERNRKIPDLDDEITSKVLKFANDTKVFRKIKSNADRQHLQDDLTRYKMFCKLTELSEK